MKPPWRASRYFGGAEPDTVEGDELEVLFTLVEAYEAKHYPIEPPDPIEAVRSAIESKILGRVSESRFKRAIFSPHMGTLKK